MIELTADDIGRSVVYQARPHGQREYGAITSYNDHFVFVRYDGSHTPQATPYHRLEWAGPRMQRDPDPGTMVEISGQDGRGTL